MEEIKAPLKEELHSLINFCRVNRFLIYASIFISLFAYGFPLTHYTLSVDEEIALSLGDRYNWSNQGRFGLDILKILFNFWNTNSITSTFLAVTLLIVTAILWAYAFYSIAPQKDKRYTPGIVVVVLFITFPAYSENIGFSMMSFELGIGWIFVTLASILVSKWALYTRKNKLYMIIGVVLTTFATSIYQAFLSVFIIGCFIQIILYVLHLEAAKTKMSFKSFFAILMKFFSISLISLILYKLIDKVIQHYNPSSGYIENFVLWGKKPVFSILKDLYLYFLDLFSGKLIYGAQILFPSVLICVCIIVYFTFKLVTKNYSGNAGVLVLSLIGYGLTPFLIYILTGTSVPVRGNLVWSLFTSSIFLFVYLLITREKLRKLLILLIIATSFYQANSISQLFYSDYQRYQEDIKLANQIGSNILNLDLGEVPQFPVVYVGKHEQQQRKGIIKQEVLGYSFFEWDNGNQLRISDFMNSLGYMYIYPTEDQKAKANQLAINMPIWPHAGSVALKDDIIIVNLSAGHGQPSLAISGIAPTGIDSNQSALSIDSLVFEPHNINLTKETGILNAISTGEDPYLIFSVETNVQNQSYDYLKIKLNSNTEGSLQLFLRPVNKDFNEVLSGTIDIHSGDNVIYCKITEVVDMLSAIRIDPPDSSQLKITDISFLNHISD